MSGNPLLIIPFSTFFILFLSLGLGLVTAFMQRKFIDLKKMKEVRAQMGELRKQMFEARKKGDRKAFAKLQRRQKMLTQDSSKVMGQQTKVMLMTMFPFLGVFYLLSYIFEASIVAVAPFTLPYGAIGPDSTWLPFWLWYFLSALAINMPINRIFRIYG